MPKKKYRYFAELLGTFCLIFVGTGSIIVNQIYGGVVTHLGVCLVFGLIVLAMIYALGDISGAHMNPAVTIGFFAAKRFPLHEVFPYIVAQLTGAVLASLVLKIMFAGKFHNFGMTLPSGSIAQSFCMEIFLTFILMFVAMGVSTEGREEGIMAGIAIGATVALEALFGGPVSGASMNPARSFAPALIAGNWQAHWIYWMAPILGSVCGAMAYQVLRSQKSEKSAKSEKSVEA